jgi:hypothetical protein
MKKNKTEKIKVFFEKLKEKNEIIIKKDKRKKK